MITLKYNETQRKEASFAPKLQIIQADGVILPCVHLQNGSCDESCVTAHPFTDSLLVTHRLSASLALLFSSAGPLKPETEIKDLQIYPPSPDPCSSQTISLNLAQQFNSADSQWTCLVYISPKMECTAN